MYQGKVCRMAKNGKYFSHFWWNLPNLFIQIMSPFVGCLSELRRMARPMTRHWASSVALQAWRDPNDRSQEISTGFPHFPKDTWISKKWYLNMQKSRSQTEEAEVEAVGYTFQGRKFSNWCHKKSEKLPHLLNDSPVIWTCCIKLWGHNSHSGLAFGCTFPTFGCQTSPDQMRSNEIWKFYTEQKTAQRQERQSIRE